MSVDEHKRRAPRQVGCMVITVSDSRTKEEDRSGQEIISMLGTAGHQVELYTLLPDEPEQIRNAIQQGLDHDDIDVILLNGGTGISGRDTTYETVVSLLDKEMPGFGELFRFLSYTEDIGSAAMLSRAVAGTCQGKAIFAMPGSTKAVQLAMAKLVIPELGHVVRELHKD